MGWDPDGPEPLYRQLADELRARIASGIYAPNRRIPSEAELSREFDLHRSTVRQALDLLRQEKLIVGVQGRGTFVRAADAPDDD